MEYWIRTWKIRVRIPLTPEAHWVDLRFVTLSLPNLPYRVKNGGLNRDGENHVCHFKLFEGEERFVVVVPPPVRDMKSRCSTMEQLAFPYLHFTS